MTMQYDEVSHVMKIAKLFALITFIIILTIMAYIYLRASILIYMGWI